jgi:hypothetical protein
MSTHVLRLFVNMAETTFTFLVFEMRLFSYNWLGQFSPTTNFSHSQFSQETIAALLKVS